MVAAVAVLAEALVLYLSDHSPTVPPNGDRYRLRDGPELVRSTVSSSPGVCPEAEEFQGVEVLCEITSYRIPRPRHFFFKETLEILK